MTAIRWMRSCEKDGIEMIAPHRSNRTKPPSQDRRRLSRYMRRWLVERFFAWIQWQRRILVRWEYHAQNFLGFVQLACPSVNVRSLLSPFTLGKGWTWKIKAVFR